MTLYLKYRPQKIDDLDLSDVREQLTNIIKSNKLPHAFLFSGPRGIGKTSSARILAKVINCEKRKVDEVEPCGECEQCASITRGSNMDVIEMDAASNRGIDDIRSLREHISLAPAKAKKKIYIIDEVHMLTTEAANAFLKTLEEPPAHVVFILATTNPEKLPQTIHSRLTNLNFRKANSKEIERQLNRVIKGEKLKVEEGVLPLIAKASEGSFRDAVKILETLSANYKEITKDIAQEFLFQNKVLQIEVLLDLLNKGQLKDSLQEIERVVSLGGSIKTYTELLIEKLHSELLTEPSDKTLQLIEVISQSRIEMSNSFIPQLPLEIAICKWCMGQTKPTTTLKIEEKVEITQVTSKPEIVVSGKEMDLDSWNKLLITVKQKNASIEALLRAARPMDFDGKTLTLGVYYQFHKERLEVGENRRTLEDVLQILFGNPVRVNCTLTEKPKVPVKAVEALQDAKDQDIIKAAEEIFGS